MALTQVTKEVLYNNQSNITVLGTLESLAVSGATTIGGNLTVQGNLYINGNTTVINANNLSINDSMIYLADDNPTDSVDIGIVSSFTDAVRYQHTGLVRDATDGTWKLFANVVTEPSVTIDFTNALYSNLRVGSISSDNFTYANGTSIVTTLNSTISDAKLEKRYWAIRK